MKTCATCQHWRPSKATSPTIGRCANRVRAALAEDMYIQLSRVHQWTNPHETCDEWEAHDPT